MALALKKILVLRFSSLGDIVMTTAMVRSLRKTYPDAQIDMVVREDFFSLIEHNPHLNRKLSLHRKSGWRGLLQLGKQLNAEKYDAIYDAHGSLRTRILMPFLRAKYKARFDKQYLSRSLALTFKLPLLDSRRFLEKFVDPLHLWGVTYDGLGPEVGLAPAAKSKATQVLPDGEPWVGLIPSAQWPGKRWAPEQFKALLALMVQRTNHRFVIFGGKADTFCEQIAEGFAADRVLNLQGKLSLSESMAAVGRCRYVIASDTGLMHVADALGVPSLLIFGPTSEKSGCLPYQPHSVLVEHDLWCRPCSKNGQAPCIRGTRVCLTRTRPEDVYRASQFLERRLLKQASEPISWTVNKTPPVLESLTEAQPL